MYQVIARKFRPQCFEDVIGQGHVTTVIKNAIDQGKIPHAFVFSGPRGVGKTTVARILAKALNCGQGLSSSPCNVCGICQDITASRAVDVFEIDAASHTGVDNIRDLIENSRYAPSIARYKTFIIDEAHMLSRSAFNALLKTLEEPPAHVVFILATTELGKIPLTVVSRCQRYDFRRIGVPEIVRQLACVADAEGVDIAEDALMLIALQADGSMRDAQGMLERVAAAGVGGITPQTVEAALGLVGRSTLHDLLTALLNKDAPSMLAIIDEVYRYGYDLSQLYRALIEEFRNVLVLKSGYEDLAVPREEKAFLKDIGAGVALHDIHRYVSVLIRSEEDFKYAGLPKITLEVILLRIIAAPDLVDIQQLIQGTAGRGVPQALAPKHAENDLAAYQRPPSTIPRSWEGFIAYLRDHDQLLHAIISKAGRVREEGNRIVLEVPSAFLAEQVQQGRKEIEKKAAAFLQREVSLGVEVLADTTAPSIKPSELRAQALKSPLVKELITEFNGQVKDVRPKE
ncbi:MAG: DNA polymerase III subunit gamma/tau [Syntrophaceae bacterium]